MRRRLRLYHRRNSPPRLIKAMADGNLLLVVDVEATCWDEPSPQVDGATTVDPVSEIIEIGYALYDMDKQTIPKHGTVLVKPIESTVSLFCTKLTSLTQSMVDQGLPFADACTLMKQWGSIPWASYGDYDRRMFVDQCARTRVPYPFTPQHLNIKVVAQAVLGGNRMGVEGTMRRLGLTFEGRPHRGGDDGGSAAVIL